MFTVEVPKQPKPRARRKICPMCTRRQAVSRFVRFDRELPCCAQCSLNFVYYAITGRP